MTDLSTSSELPTTAPPPLPQGPPPQQPTVDAGPPQTNAEAVPPPPPVTETSAKAEVAAPDVTAPSGSKPETESKEEDANPPTSESSTVIPDTTASTQSEAKASEATAVQDAVEAVVVAVEKEKSTEAATAQSTDATSAPAPIQEPSVNTDPMEVEPSSNGTKRKLSASEVEESGEKKSKPEAKDEPKENGDAKAAEVGNEESEETKEETMYEEKMAELQAECDAIKNETHHELVEEFERLSKEKKRKLQDADMMRSLRDRENQALYAFETKAAEDEYEGEKKLIMSKLLGQIGETIKKLENLRDGVNVEQTKIQRRALRSKTKGDANGFEALDFERSSRNKKSNEGLGINFFMEETDIVHDLKMIQSNWSAAAQKFSESDAEAKNISARIKHGRLYYNDEEFVKDDNIVVYTELTKEELLGQIASVLNNEVSIKLLDDTKARLLLSHLQSGRCKISKNKDAME